MELYESVLQNYPKLHRTSNIQHLLGGLKAYNATFKKYNYNYKAQFHNGQYWTNMQC